MKVLEAKDVKDIDANFLKNGYTMLELINIAANCVYKHVKQFKRPLIVVGKGYNGSDGMALANLYKKDGIDANIFYVDKSNMVEESKVLDTGFDVFNEDTNYDVIIDAIFGIGFHPPLNPYMMDLINKLNNLKGYKVSIDIPSGKSVYDEGDLYFKPDLVVTFMATKYLYVKGKYNVVVETLGIENLDNYPTIIDKSMIVNKLKKRKYDDYKNKNGVVVHFTGSDDYIGASVMAASGSLYSGSGIVIVDSNENVCKEIHHHLLEVVTKKVSEYKYDAYLIGCGYGINNDTKYKLEQLLKEDIKLVIDADGLNVLALNLDLLCNKKAKVILTPHIGEFKRLNKEGLTLQEFAIKYDVIVVLKGPYTKIMGEDYYVNSTGNLGMAIGGSGDVLAGMITSFVGQGYSLMDSCILGVYFHGLAGDTVFENEYMVLPTKLIKEVPKLMKLYENKKDQAI